MEYVKLRNYIELISGRDLTKCQYNDKNDGIPYIMGASNMTNGKLNIERWTDKPTVIGEKFDLIISVKGTVGELLILEEEKVHLSRQVMAIRPKKQYDVKFMFYYMKYYLDRLKAKAKGMIPGVTREDILDAEFIEVSSEKQQKIIKILDKAQELIDKRKEQIEALDELVKSQFIEMFGDPVTNPKNIKQVYLKDISELITKGASPNWQGIEYVDDDTQTLFVTSENVRDGYIDLSKKKYLMDAFNEKQKRSVLNKGDFLINIVGASIGRAAQFNLNVKANINQAVALVRLKEGLINDKYLLTYLNSPKALKMYESMQVSVARANLSLQNINDLEILLPPIELQNQFANFVKQVDKLKFEMQESLKELEDNFNSLMQRAFKGELFI
ncbi:restriction endonuclease subunit S [Clostridium neonatale]|uniref:restriction endonuclease subunit S n=1 Tax=Clostridium neonatale TaxID=137838 RepID=UPI00291BAC53|nr:restriction endonuclease subunit S [Clostridium neonatale]CAI3211327.1 type I restriction enzyme, S subunit [Clostridium neonatale]CAI3617041.1 type I restriction enzyme, S subunit [Clostridium neonatale]CAI3619335.1 type I restriction enzyme, S subunit [Clostridium neonatale]CAI3645425.1 type I restriction enzyme, S subunit [Clostridium neonatale]CAI3669691.1 type I restriction enzyme, S subunit [Clostridium neonatale]